MTVGILDLDKPAPLATEQRFRALAQASADFVYCASPNWSEIRQVFGRQPAPAAGESLELWLRKCVHSDDQPAVSAALAAAIAAKTMVQLEHRAPESNANPRWTALRAVPVLDPNGAVVEWIAAASDITEHKAAHARQMADQQKIANKFAELDALYAEAPLGLGLLDRDLRFLRINEALAQMNGHSVEAHLGRQVWDLVPDLRAAAEPKLRQVLASGQPLRNVVIRGETPASPGIVREWREHFYPLRLDDGEVHGVGIVCEDVTDRIAAERALADSEARLAAAVRAGKVGVHECIPSIGAIVWDQTVRDLWGVSATEPISVATLAAGIHPDDLADVRAAIAAAIDPAGSGHYEAVYRVIHRETKEVRWVRSDGETTFPEDGPARLIGTIKDITAQLQKEAALAESEARYRNLIDLMPAAMYAVDAEGRITLFNQQAAAIWGRAPALGAHDELFCGSFRLWRQDGSPLPREETPMAEALRTGASFRNQEAEVEREDGARVIASVNIDPVRDANGAIVGAVNVFLDITERKRAEAALRESEARFRQVAESLPQLIWTCEPDGLCGWLSPQWLRYTGRPEAEQLGYGWLEQLHPEDRARTFTHWRETVSAGAEFRIEFRIRRHDGVYRWFRTLAVPLRGADGSILKWFGSNTDIHDLQEAQALLRTSEQRFRAVFDYAGAGIAITDLAGRLQSCNPAFSDMLGFSEQELSDLNYEALIHPNDRDANRDEIRRLLAGEAPSVEIMNRYVRKDGEILWAHEHVSLLRDAADRPANIIALVTDVT